MNQQKTSLAESVWQNLYSINVSKNIEKKGNLSYLSWTWAWQALMEEYPQATYTIDDRSYPDGSMEVYVTISIQRGDESISRMMWLPVMDNRNKAIKNPDARQISDARMRCLVKCIAMLGLGSYIYAGEDLPHAEKEQQLQPISENQQQTIRDMANESAIDFNAFLNYFKLRDLSEMTSAQYEQAHNILAERIAQANQPEEMSGYPIKDDE
jgi:hypothetical protein